MIYLNIILVVNRMAKTIEMNVHGQSTELYTHKDEIIKVENEFKDAVLSIVKPHLDDQFDMNKVEVIKRTISYVANEKKIKINFRQRML